MLLSFPRSPLQLRGRSGRQGDPGSTRYFLSLEDNLFRVFGGDRMKNLMTAFRIDDLPLESRMLTSSLDEAQKKVEQYYYELRCACYSPWVSFRIPAGSDFQS